MKTWICLAFLGAGVLSAQTPNISGVWKVNLEKSKLTGPPPSNYLIIIDQQDPTLKQTIGVYGPRGEQRSSYAFTTDGKPALNGYRGLPMRTEGVWKDGALVLDSKIAGAKPSTMTETYSLSGDGNTLTVVQVIKANGKETQQTMVLDKRPDTEGEALRKPEVTAGERFKNVQLLKTLPASQFLDTMRSFNMSLGVDCEHCHVQGKMDADEKPAKLMARKMLTMTQNINEQTFAGKNEVRCYTCHRGQADPQSRPAF